MALKHRRIHPGRCIHKYLLDLRQGFERLGATGGGIRRDDPPAQDVQPFGLEFFLECGTGRVGLGRIGIQKHHAHGILLTQLEASLLRHLAQEAVRLFQ